MRRNVKNEKVIRAMAIGISAMLMASSPLTAMAAEGDTGENPGGAKQEADTTGENEFERSEESEQNDTVSEKLTDVKEDYIDASDAAMEEEQTEQAGNYAEVAGSVSDILSDIEKLNKANDKATADKDKFEEKTDAAQEAVEAADKALGNAEDEETEDGEGTSLMDKTESANEVTGDLADDAKEAEQNAATAGSRTEVEQAAQDANNAATATEGVNDELQRELSEAENSVVAAEKAVEDAANAYKEAKDSAKNAQNALADILINNGLTDVTALYSVDEEGNFTANETELAKLNGDAAAAVEAALKACQAADAKVADAEQELSKNKLVFAGKISELQEQIKTLEKQEYWDATKTMNEYLIRYELAENEDYILNENSFGKWYIDKSTGFENDNYVPVTMLQAVRDENGEYVLDDNGNKTYEEVTKYFNYHKEDKTIATGNDKDKSIYVVEKNQETGTKTVTDAEAYTEYWLANEEGNRLESVTDEEGNVTSHKIVTTDSEGNKSETEVSGEIVTVKKGEDANSQAVLDDTVFENRVSETDVLKQTSVGDSKNGSVTTKEVVEGSESTSYEYTKVTVVDEYGTKNVERASEEIYYKSDAKDYISKAFQTENTVVTIKFDKQIDGELFHSTEYSFTYNSREEFEANFSKDVEGLKNGVLWTYDITVYDVVTDYDKVISSHEADAVIATTTADIKATTDSVQTVVTKADGSKITGDKKSSVSSADDNVWNKLVDSYKNQYPGCTVSDGDYNKWNGKGTFTVTSADRLTFVEVSYDIDTDWQGHWEGWNYIKEYKSSVTYSEKIAVTSKESSVAKENKVLSQNVFLADVYTNGSTDHEAVTHEEEYKYWKESEEALIKESSVDFTEYNKYTAAKKEAEEKAAQAQSLYEKLLVALNNLNELNAVEDVKNDEFIKAQNKVASLRTAYNDAAEAAKTAAENAEKARTAANNAALYAANWVDPVTPAGDEGTDDTTGETTVTTPVVLATVPAATVNVVAPTPVAQPEVVEIEEEVTPLAPAVEENKQEETKAEPESQETIQLDDEATPLADIIVEDEQTKMSWWWLLIVALLGATGYEMYRKHNEKKALAQNAEQDAE